MPAALRPLLGAALLLVPAELWAQEPTTAPTPARLVLNGTVLGAGLGLGSSALYSYAQTREAYQSYLDEPSDSEAEWWLTNEVRPRQVATIAQGAASLAAITAGVALWATTEGLDGPLDPDEGPGRKVLGSTALGAGAVSATAAVYNYAQAREAYLDYLDEPDESAAETILEDQVRPRQTVAAIQAGIALLGLGAGTISWVGGERVSVSGGPNHVAFEARW